MLKFKKNQKGFTLIEVLLVIVILGVLAAIAIPRFLTTEAQAKINACNTQISQLRTQIEKWHFDKNAYPADLATLIADGNYFPNGASVNCPVTPATAYTYVALTGTLVCPNFANHQSGT